LNPSATFKIPVGKFSPYLKAGLFFGLINQLTYNGINEFYLEPYTETDNGGLSFGMTAAAGLEVMASNRIGIFGELFFRYANYSPARYTAYDSFSGANESGNFKDNVAQVPGYSGPSVLGNSYFFAGNVDRPIEYIPLNALGLSLGLRYYLGKN
jgi:hypothetical protein